MNLCGIQSKSIGPAIPSVDQIKGKVVAIGLAVNNKSSGFLLKILTHPLGHQPMTEIHHQHHVCSRDLPAQALQYLPFHAFRNFSILKIIHGKKLGDLFPFASGFDESLFKDRGVIPIPDDPVAGAVQTLPQQGLNPWLPTHNTNEPGLRSKDTQVTVNSKGAPGLRLFPQKTTGNNPVFGGQPLDCNGGIAIEYKIPNHKNFEPGKLFNLLAQLRPRSISQDLLAESPQCLRAAVKLTLEEL